MSEIIVIDHHVQESAGSPLEALRYLNFFDPAAAYDAVINHVLALPSSQTPEQHTLRAYESGLTYFGEWMSYQMPTADRIGAYIAHLKAERGLKSSTIASKYLAPVRLYLKKLAAQHIETRRDGSPLTMDDRTFVQDCREFFRQAADVKNPKADTTSYRSALYTHGERLTLLQVNTIFGSLDTDRLDGLRDLALLYVGFTSGMRLAELQRMTLADIRQGADCYEAHVRGKRSNIDPVPLDAVAVDLIGRWVEAYNHEIGDEADPRWIGRDVPIWQAIQHNGTPFPAGYQNIEPAKGMSVQSIRGIVTRRTEAALGFAISPHDMRRTVAAIGRQAGMDYDELRVLLRHKDISTTARYVGNPPSLQKSLVSNRVNFQIAG